MPQCTEYKGEESVEEGSTRVAHMTKPVCRHYVPVIQIDFHTRGCLQKIKNKNMIRDRVGEELKAYSVAHNKTEEWISPLNGQPVQGC